MGSRVPEIVAVARQLLESGGPEAVTMRAIAERLGIRAPSLYKHIPDKEDLEHALIAVGFAEQAGAFTAAQARHVSAKRPAAGAGGDPLLAALAAAYREWALAHPHLYRLVTARPLDRTRLPPGVETRAAAPVVAACGGDTDLARAVWAFAHGMVSLELAGRFPPDADLDTAWRVGIDAFVHAVDTKTPNPETPNPDPS